MGNGKLCPLMGIANAILEATGKYEDGVLAPACEEEHCAWWDRLEEMCAVKRLSQVAEAVHESCLSIVKLRR